MNSQKARELLSRHCFHGLAGLFLKSGRPGCERRPGQVVPLFLLYRVAGEFSANYLGALRLPVGRSSVTEPPHSTLHKA